MASMVEQELDNELRRVISRYIDLYQRESLRFEINIMRDRHGKDLIKISVSNFRNI